MLGYVTIGSNDPDTASAFHDAIFTPLGEMHVHSFNRGVFYGETEIELPVLKPCNGEAAAYGNDPMAGLKAPSRDTLDAVHALAFAMGGSDEGATGILRREQSGFYGAYFPDPEGNKLCVYRKGPA